MGENELIVQQIIGHKFKDETLLTRALTHTSYITHEHGGKGGDYQRLEFLGDALLEFIVTEKLFGMHPEYDEGQLTKLRAEIVSRNPLAKAIEDSGLVNYVYCESEMSKKLKSDVFEALLAAIYLDSNSIKASRKFVNKMLGKLIANKEIGDVVDYKSKMYEYCAAKKVAIEFVLDNTEGEAHELRFKYSLYIDGKRYSTAVGKTKREAQQLCSKEAYAIINEPHIKSEEKCETSN